MCDIKSEEVGLKRKLPPEEITLEKPENNSSPLSFGGRLSEDAVGITEYLGTHQGFNGIIKQRYSDFLVNEIDLDGQVVRMTDLEPPADIVPNVDETLPEEYKKALPEETWARLRAMCEGDECKDSCDIEVTNLSKEERKLIHQAVSRTLTKLQTNTQEKEDGKKYIVIQRQTAVDNRGLNRRGRWPRERPEFIQFALSKENMDTMEAVNLIASKLRVKPNMFSYAGTKDRRAKTCQWMSVPRVDAKRLTEVVRSLRRLAVGNFCYKSRPVRLGDLQGNRFCIVLRNVTASNELITEATSNLSERGFVNYFGLQRFGTTSVPTHHIGRELLKGKWESAVELVLKPREGREVNENLSEARKTWWEKRDAAAALKCLQHGADKSIEGKLLLGLSRHGAKNYVNALEMIPKNTRLMYIHAYQSYIWNVIASRRIKKYGLKPIVGDLLLKDVKCCDVEEVEGKTKRIPTPTVLTEGNLSEASIEDVVLPLPGFDIKYPENETKDWFEEMLANDGLQSSSLRQKVKTYSLGGTYRKLILRPVDFTWKLRKYNDPQEQLVLSDLDVLNNVPEPPDVPDGKYKALVVEFSLPSSTYATMALREILKADTSAAHQASLNDYCTEPEAKKVCVEHKQ